MKHLTPTMRDLARKLLDHEAGQNADAEDVPVAEARAGTKLRVHLVRLVGLEGFLALLSRALVLTKIESPEMASVEVMPDGSLAWPQPAPGHDARAADDGLVTLLGHILSLLDLFIGEALTLRLLHEAWPELGITNISLKEGTER